MKEDFDIDPAFLRAQAQKLFAAKQKVENEIAADAIRRAMRETPLHNRPKQEAKSRPLGCSLFFVVALAWCFIACAPSKAFKQQAARILDQDRQMHYYACIEPIEQEVDPLTGGVVVEEWPHLFPQDICEQWEARLIEAEPTLEDEFAKQRALQTFIRDKVIPWALPYIEQGAYAAATWALTYFTGGLLGGALQAAAAP